MSYLITGGCGFLGSNLAAELLRQGRAVTVFDNLSRTGAELNLNWLRSLGAVQFVRGDIRHPTDVEAVISSRKPDVIFHLAGQVAMTTSLQSPRLDFEINVLGSINVLESVRQHCPKTAIVYSSSNKVYGDIPDLDLQETATRYQPRCYPHGIAEAAPLDFHTPYGCSKGAADQYVLDYARCFGLNTVVFRHSTIYGSRQFATFDQGWVGWFCRQALLVQSDPKREPFTISGDGKQVRDLLHADDAVRCYLAAADHIDSARGQAFNIGGGMSNSLSLLELFARLEQKLGVSLTYTKLPWRTSDQRFFVADIRKAQQYLRWSPQVTSDQGIDAVVSWEREMAVRLATAAA